MTRDNTLKELSELISAKPPFSSCNVDLPIGELERILSELRNFKGNHKK